MTIAYIEIQETPNPTTLRFLVDTNVPAGTSLLFENLDQCQNNSPLVAEIISIGGVESVLLTHDAIAVTKREDKKWVNLKTLIVATIMDYLNSGREIVERHGQQASFASNKANGTQKLAKQAESNQAASEIEIQIKELIDKHVRPAVAQDGGDIEFDRFEEGVVYLKLRGACSGCPSSLYTLKNGIENLLKHHIPEVIEVREAAY